MSHPVAALRAWFNGTWDDACSRCGLCCYEREVGEGGNVAVNLSEPCEFLDEQSRTCRVYDERFKRCDRCHRLTPRVVLFSNHLPPSCGYLRKFR